MPVNGSPLLWPVKQDSARFVAYHALQALVVQVIVDMLAGVAFRLGLLLFVLSSIWGVQANRGEWAGYPFLKPIGR